MVESQNGLVQDKRTFLVTHTVMDWNRVFFLQLYHPSRILTLIYQPFAVGTMLILAYNEAKINTRIRNIFGYILFSLGTLGLLVVSSAISHFVRFI